MPPKPFDYYTIITRYLQFIRSINDHNAQLLVMMHLLLLRLLLIQGPWEMTNFELPGNLNPPRCL